MSNHFPILAFLDVGGGEMLMIMFVVLLFFGGEKLPGFARGLGKAIRDFKKAASGVEDEIKRAMEEPPKPYVPPPALTLPPPPHDPVLELAPPGSHDAASSGPMGEISANAPTIAGDTEPTPPPSVAQPFSDPTPGHRIMEHPLPVEPTITPPPAVKPDEPKAG